MSAFALMCIVLSLILSRVCVHLKTARSRLHSVMTPRPALPPLFKAPALLPTYWPVSGRMLRSL